MNTDYKQLIEDEMTNFEMTTRIYEIRRKFKFEAAHRLYQYDGPCSNIHGHSYKGELCIKVVNLNQNGMVIDFTELKQFDNDFIQKKFDHAFILNDDDELATLIQNNCDIKLLVLPSADTKTTAERFCQIIGDALEDYIEPKLERHQVLHRVRVDLHETENNIASYEIRKG